MTSELQFVHLFNMRLKRASRNLLRGACAVFFALTLAGSSIADGQVTETVFASLPGISSGRLILASDGNFYGTTQNGGASNAGTIFKVTPAGTLTVVYSFTGGADGGGGSAGLIEGTDDILYGTTFAGGNVSQNGLIAAGTIFSFDPESGSLITLHSFDFDENGFSPSSPLVEGQDGILYGTTVGGGPSVSEYPIQCGVLFSIHRDGSGFTILLPFPGDGSVAYEPGALVQGADGNFYGASSEGGANLLGSIFQVTRAGAATVPWSFTGNADGANPRTDPLVEGPDGSFYGTTANSENNNQGGVVYQLPQGKDINELHSFVDSADGFIVSGGVVWGSDGYLYGTTGYGGDSACTSTYFNGCGTFFRVKPDGTGFETLYKFGAAPDASVPVGAPIQASDGDFYGITTVGGSSGNGAIYKIQLEATPDSISPPAPISLVFTVQSTGAPVLFNATVAPNTPLLLDWDVTNAFSDTMRNCNATVYGLHSGSGDWFGIETGTVKAEDYYGEADITPTVAGTYTYTLTCGGTESGFVTLQVGSVLTVTTTTLPNGTVGKDYVQLLDASGGVEPYTWQRTAGKLPPGLSYDSATGGIYGTPTQFGAYPLTFQVTDSSQPALTASVSVTITVDSGLAVTPEKASFEADKTFTQILTATGGTPPYTFAQASGDLPDGVNFDEKTNSISGMTSDIGTTQLTFYLTDSEHPNDLLTFPFTLTITPSQPIITATTLPNPTVGTAYSQTLTAMSGAPPYTFSITAGSLPRGLSLAASTGTISGTPTQFTKGSPFTVQVMDTETPPQSSTSNLSIAVNSGLLVTTNSLIAGQVSKSYTAQLAATGGLAPYVWSIVSGSLPQGMTLDSSTGVIAGTPIAAGSYNITAQVTDAEGSPANATASLTLTIAAPPALTATTITSSSAVAGVGMNVTFTATVTDSAASPTGMVNFFNGTTSLGSVALGANGSASFTTSFPSPGIYSILVSYGGDASSAASTSAPLTETVVTPTVSGVVSPSTLTIKSGSSGTLVITLTPVGGYTGTVNFSCGTLPAHVSCTFAPPSVALSAGSGPVTDTLTINTAAETSAQLIELKPLETMVLAFALWLPVSWRSRRAVREGKLRQGLLPKLMVLLAIILGSGVLGLTGCGGGNGSATAHPGTYTVPITLNATSGSIPLNATVVVE